MPNNDYKVFVRMPKEVYASLMDMAETERRSVNSQILVLLEKIVREHREMANEAKS